MSHDHTDQPDSRPEITCCQVEQSKDGILRVELPENLDTATVGQSWSRVFSNLKRRKFTSMVVDGRHLKFCDTSGLSFLQGLQEHVHNLGHPFEIVRLPRDTQIRLTEFQHFLNRDWQTRKPVSGNWFVSLGEGLHNFLRDLKEQVAFLGELLIHTLSMLKKPWTIPWGEVVELCERTGARALGIVSLISFLIGLIMAFQSAIPMKQFGAELYVADLVGISLVRELGPLMTAILLAGRSGAAFAAEIGTMKVNEEIDALTTMGLKPVRFLVVTRVMAAVVMTPILTAYADLVGLIGGGVVFCSFGFPVVTYLHELDLAVSVVDFVGGTGKAFVFGFLVASIGCLRGLQTRSGASSVGKSTTSAVVSGIVLIVLADGIFSVVYYFLGI